MSAFTHQEVFCDACNFDKAYQGGLPRQGPRYVYDLGNDAVFPMHVQKSWCYDCADFKWIEKLPTYESIAAYRAAHEEKTRIGKPDQGEIVKRMHDALYGSFDDDRLFEAVCLTHEVAWKEFARDRTGSKPRCLTCRSEHTSGKINLDVDDEGVFVRFSHPGCGGILKIREVDSGLRISYRTDHTPGQLLRFYDGDCNVIGPKSHQVTTEELAAMAKDSAPQQTAKVFPHYAQPRNLLQSNPFCVLQASIHDDNVTIVARAEERSLVLDPDICTAARTTLGAHRTRLAAELCWFPGVPPEQVPELLDNIDMAAGLGDYNTIVTTNYLAGSLQLHHAHMLPNILAKEIVALALKSQEISAQEVLSLINNDRNVAGFSAVPSVGAIDVALAAHRKELAVIIRNILDTLPSLKMVGVMTDVIERATQGLTDNAPLVLEEVLEQYEAQANQFLIPESENIERLTALAREKGSEGYESVKLVIDEIELMITKWHSIAKPIQMGYQVRGLEHPLSLEVAGYLRDLAGDLHEQYRLTQVSLRIVSTMKELFAHVPTIVAKLENDESAINERLAEQVQSQQDDARTDSEITYETRIGILFKDTLSISRAGIQWKGKQYRLEDITWVRWGAVRKSTNGRYTGTDYTIAFGSAQQSSSIETSKEDIYTSFTDALWKAVCVRMIGEMLIDLRGGKIITFGKVTFTNAGISLTKRRFLSNEIGFYPWVAVGHSSKNGELEITAQYEKNTSATLSYLHTKNAHLLEALIRNRTTKGWATLSGD